MNAYSKKDAKMTQGFAILCMLVLHLFCRLGKDVYGTPIIWVSPEKPLVYLFGFFAGVCVPIYSMCAGYEAMQGGLLKIQYIKKIGSVSIN